MIRITFSTKNGQPVASGILGQDIIELEGYYYFNPDKVNLESLTKENSAYTCPIKRSTCDYYYVADENGQKLSREIAWIYPTITNSLFKKIEDWVGFYPQSSEGLLMESVEI